MQVGNRGESWSLNRYYNEFNAMTTKLKGWDHTFENAVGTYPTHEFVDKFESTMNWAKALVGGADANQFSIDGSIYGPYEQLSRTILRPQLSALLGTLFTSPLKQLHAMADKHTPFGTTGVSWVNNGVAIWPSMLDALIAGFQAGARQILAASIRRGEDVPPATPNPGPGGGTWSPGGPAPTPIP